MRKGVVHVQFPIQHSSLLGNPRLVTGLWMNLPQTNRQQLLWLLSHLLERQLEPIPAPNKEDGDEDDKRAE